MSASVPVVVERPETSVPYVQAERDLPQMVIPGGPYLRVRLRGDPPEVYDEITAAYAHLESSADRDDSRPSLERYRRLDEIDVLMPVTQSPHGQAGL